MHGVVFDVRHRRNVVRRSQAEGGESYLCLFTPLTTADIREIGEVKQRSNIYQINFYSKEFSSREGSDRFSLTYEI